MNRVLPATAIVAAAMFSGATGASAAPPAPLASSAAKDFSQIEKVYDRGTRGPGGDSGGGSGGLLRARTPADRIPDGARSYLVPPSAPVGVPFFRLRSAPAGRYTPRRYDGRHFYADW